MKKYLYALVSIMVLSWFQISFADSDTYKLVVDGKTFDIRYKLDGNVIAMEADQESTSLLVGTADVTDSMFEIGFSSEVLSATNGEFIVLVDGLETDYTISYSNGDPTMTFPIKSGSEEVEIIGTSVIPEFPLEAVAVMGIVSSIALILSRTKSVFK
ncbi:MAG: hypothetical protein ACK4TO_06370 [Candidatus Nitrosotenuis sp.]